MSRNFAAHPAGGAVCKVCGCDLSVRLTKPRVSDGKVYCTNHLCRNHRSPVRLGQLPHLGPQPA